MGRMHHDDFEREAVRMALTMVTDGSDPKICDKANLRMRRPWFTGISLERFRCYRRPPGTRGGRGNGPFRCP